MDVHRRFLINNGRKVLRYFFAYEKIYQIFFYDTFPSNNYKKRLANLYKEKKALYNSIIFLKSAYSHIDTMFQKEIVSAESKAFFTFFNIYNCFNCRSYEEQTFDWNNILEILMKDQ